MSLTPALDAMADDAHRTMQSQEASREENRVKLAEAEMEMRRCLVTLRLELPNDVWQDVNRRFAAYRDAAWDAHNRETR